MLSLHLLSYIISSRATVSRASPGVCCTLYTPGAQCVSLLCYAGLHSVFHSGRGMTSVAVIREDYREVGEEKGRDRQTPIGIIYSNIERSVRKH